MFLIREEYVPDMGALCVADVKKEQNLDLNKFIGVNIIIIV